MGEWGGVLEEKINKLIYRIVILDYLLIIEQFIYNIYKGEIMLKDRINQKEAYIVLDTNVLLNIYRYPEEFFEFAIFCIKEIIDYIVLPKTVCIEYDKHRKKEFSKYIKKYEFLCNDYKCNIEKFYDKLINDLKENKNLDKFDDLSNFVNEINNSRNELLNRFDIFTEKYIKYFNTIVDSYKKKDFVYDDIYSNITNKLCGLQQECIYKICENGKYRYKKKIGPGYMDAEKKMELINIQI